jgi:hypothetical protein
MLTFNPYIGLPKRAGSFIFWSGWNPLFVIGRRLMVGIGRHFYLGSLWALR